MGAPKWPPNPQRSERPGGPVALLCFALFYSRDSRRDSRVSEGAAWARLGDVRRSFQRVVRRGRRRGAAGS